MSRQTFWSGVKKLACLMIVSLSLSHQALSLDYTISPDGAGYKAVPVGGGQDITGNKAYEVINAAIQKVSDEGGGKVHLVAGTYEVTDFDTITDDDATWVSARPEVTIEKVGSPLPPYQARGSFVTKIAIPANPQLGLIAYVNFDTPIDLSKYPAMAYWLFPSTRIMQAGTHRFEFTFSRELNGANPIRRVKVYHPEPGNLAIHNQWRGHRLPSYSGSGEPMFLNSPNWLNQTQLTDIRSIGIELVGVNTGYVDFSNKPVVLHLDDLTAHYGQIEINKDKGHQNVILEGDGPYHTIIRMKDYGNLPMIYLTAKNSEIRYLQIHGNTDNATLIDYCAGINAPWADLDLTGTKIHHNFIHQTQGSSIYMRGSNTLIYENLLTHSENPMVSAASGNNNDIAHNTLKYCTNDAFIYLRYGRSNGLGIGNQVRNNSFWPITPELRSSNSPDNPASYPQRFNSFVKRGVDVNDYTYGHTIKNNKFYNLRVVPTPVNPDDTEYQGVLISDGSHDIRVENNHFYNSNADIQWGAGSQRVEFIGNYFENGFFGIRNGNYIKIDGNIFANSSKLSLLSGLGHSGADNYFDATSQLVNQTSSTIGTVQVPPTFNEVNAGVSWEWGAVPNGGFEDGNGSAPNGWASVGSDANTTHVWISAANYGVHGIKAIQTSVAGLNATSAMNHVAAWVVNDYIPVSAGETLTAQAIVRMENYQGFNISPEQDGLRFRVDYFREDGSPCSIPSESVGAIESNSSWIRLKKEILIPNDCSKLRPGIYLSNANGTFTADEVKLYRKMQGLIAVAKSGSGDGVVTSSPAGINCGSICSADYDVSTTVMLTAEAGNDSVFEGWISCDMPVGNTCAVGINSSRNVAAIFDLKTADLAVTVTDTPDPALTNSPLSYTLTATNAGPSAATNVVVTHTLPTGVTGSGVPSQGSCTGTSVISCNLGTLNNGQSATVTVTATPGAEALFDATPSNTFNVNVSASTTVSATEPDPVTANNAATTITNVRLACLGQPVTKRGTSGNDGTSSKRFAGGNGADVIHTLSGADWIDGKNGNDTLCGGAGNDNILGNGGADALSGGPGSDTCNGGSGTDSTDGSCETVNSIP